MIRLALAALLASTGAVSAQTRCIRTADAYAGLTRQHHEARRFFGLARHQVLEVWLSESGRWTVLVTRPDGVSCIVAAGEAGQIVEPVRGEPG